MVPRILAPLRRIDWKTVAARAGAFASDHKAAGRRLLFAAGFALVVLLVHREVYSYIEGRDEYSVPEVRAAIAPSWTSTQGVEIVRVETEGISLFDPGLVDRVGRAFEACPWVRRVVAVERAFPDQLRVRLEYRRPHVAVRRASGYVLVDESGVRLPGVYATPPACDREPVIVGVGSRAPRPGSVWDDAALKEGMRLADFAAGQPLLEELAVRTIDVSNYAGRVDRRRSQVSLVCANGCTLMWGRTTETERFGDPDPEDKLENLRHVLARYPDLRGLRYVKLYFRGRGAVELRQDYVQGR